jgi:hypothetical protein
VYTTKPFYIIGRLFVGLRMNRQYVDKVPIRVTDIPLKNGTIRWMFYGGVMTIEVELDVHQTIIKCINTSGFLKERVRITSEKQTEMAGKFAIHDGTSSILLTSDINVVEGAEKFTPTPLDNFPMKRFLLVMS